MSNAKYKWWVVGMLWLVCFINYADRQSIFSVFPLLRTELRLSDLELGIAGASFMWVYALFGPVAGWLRRPLVAQAADPRRARLLVRRHGLYRAGA